jgi:hypothetical protein
VCSMSTRCRISASRCTRYIIGHQYLSTPAVSVTSGHFFVQIVWFLSIRSIVTDELICGLNTQPVLKMISYHIYCKIINNNVFSVTLKSPKTLIIPLFKGVGCSNFAFLSGRKNSKTKKNKQSGTDQDSS